MSDDLLESLKKLSYQGKGDVRRINKIILKLDEGEELEERDKDYVDSLDSLISETSSLNMDDSKFSNHSFDDKVEIEKILDHLDSDDDVLIVAKQAKFRPGGALTSPNTIFATNKKIIIRNPTMLGMRESIEEINYDQITSVKLEKGLFSATILIRSPGLSELSRLSGASGLIAWGRGEEGQIDGIPKDKAEQIVRIIKEKMEEVKKSKRQSHTKGDDPMTILKRRFALGEITKEEFEDMKSALE